MKRRTLFSLLPILGLVLTLVVLLFSLAEAARAQGPVLEDACALLDDPAKRSTMSGMFATHLLTACGREEELGRVRSPTPSIQPFALGTEVLVNDPTGEPHPSATQSETSIARNEDSGVLCSAYNDAYSGVMRGRGFTGFSHSDDDGTTWVDHGSIGVDSLGDPATVWRRKDGHFYHASLHANVVLERGGLGLWDLGTGCTSSTFVDMIHTGSGDDKELMAVDNNPASPYYGRLYVVWTDSPPNGPIYVTTSDNAGISWSPPVNISSHEDVQGAWPAVNPVFNDVYVAWVHSITDTFDIEVVRSIDGGVTWMEVTKPLTNAVLPRDKTATEACPSDALKGYIRHQPFPQIVVDHSRNLHVVYSYDPDGYNTGDVINVYYRRSTTQGATWEPEIQLNDDGTKTDQWFPALAVADNGTVGTFWYDRRLDTANNLMFDYYSTFSYDNGLTFQPNKRVSDVSSPVVLDPNLFSCYHGDYDTSIAGNGRFYVQWSDDHRGDPDIYLDVDSPIRATPTQQDICIPDDAVYNVEVDQILGPDPVSLSANGEPAGTTVNFSANPAIPPGASTLTIGNTGAAVVGNYNINIVGVASTSIHTTTVGLNLFDSPPGAVTFTSPSNGATDISLLPTLTWTAATQGRTYNLEIATDPSFSNIVYSVTVINASHTIASQLDPETVYYWRVRANNPCSVGGYSTVFSFTTTPINIIVNSTDENRDTNYGDGVCDDGMGNCTLRAAIEETNAIPGTDTIKFNIPGPIPHTIQPTLFLPTITDPVVIDGTTQPGFAGTPIIELDGSIMTRTAPGLNITAGNSTVRGLVINRFSEGINLKTNGGNVIEGNFIGTNVNGTVALGNREGGGVDIDNVPNNIIGGTTAGKGNVIAGHFSDGVSISGNDAIGNRVQSNFIGTDVTGTAALGNGWGVFIYLGASGNTIGGLASEAGNTIAFNHDGGIYNSGDVELINNTIRDNAAFSGGGIYNEGTATLINSTVSGNSANGGIDVTGGGIHNAGTLMLINSTVSGNSATATGRGGGIFNVGIRVELTDSTISGNFAHEGGGIFNDGGIVELTNSTISGNSALAIGRGGGIFNDANGTTRLTNSTISGNSATERGGGIYNRNGTLRIQYDTIVKNSAEDGGGIFNTPELGVVEIGGTILAKNEDEDCFGSITPLVGYNLIEKIDSCIYSGGTGDLIGIDPIISYLQDNGGPTFTHGLMMTIDPAHPSKDSPAIDQVPLHLCPATDQRGKPRPVDILGVGNDSTAFCDIGAFERQEDETAITLLSFTAQPTVDHITLTWQTGTEIDNAGFNLHRATSAAGPYTKLNDALIPAQGDAHSGTSYAYTDTEVVKGVTYYYKLEDVDIYGVSTFHGPVTATPGPIRSIYLPVIIK